MSTDLIIADVTILQDVQGRYSLNGLHQASGRDMHKRPGHWLKRKLTRALIAHVQVNLGLAYPAVVIQCGGNAAGTFAHTIIADAYRQWLSQPKILSPTGDAGYVYVVQYNNEYPVKIGYSTTPLKRLEVLQFSSPVPLTFRHLWHAEHARVLEQTLHKRFASVRTHGEWFQLGEAEETILLTIMRYARGVIATTLPGGVMAQSQKSTQLLRRQGQGHLKVVTPQVAP